MVKKRTTRKTKPKGLLSKELKVYKERLIDFKEDLLNQIKDISKGTLMKTPKDISGDISGYGIHMADVASDNYEREFNLGLVSDEHKVLLDIEDAFKRIEDKTYGVCPTCRKLISARRLKVIPYARYCTKCKNKLEKENII